MIASPVKQEDLEHLATLIEVLESAVRGYQRTGNKEYTKHIEYFHSEITKLREKIDTHDYTEDDKRHNRVYSSLKMVIPNSG